MVSNNVIGFNQKNTQNIRGAGGGHSGGNGGSGGRDDMVERVSKLEANVENIGSIVRETASEIKIALQSIAQTNVTVARVEAKLDDKPSTWKVVTIVLVIGGLLVAANIANVKLLSAPLPIFAPPVAAPSAK